MPVTDADLEKQAKAIQNARDKLAKLQSTRESREVEIGNEIVSTQMDAELAMLERQIEVENERSKVGAVRSGVENTLDAARAAMDMASGKTKPPAPAPAPEKKE